MDKEFWYRLLGAELARVGVADANESLAFSRELEAFVGDVYELAFVELKALDLFPADPSVHPADTSYTTRQMRQAATANIIADWTTDLPVATYDARGENNYPIRSVGNGYVVTIQDLRTAAKLGRPLETKLAEACKRAHAEVFEQVAFFGDSAFGLKGLFSDAGVLANSTPKVGVAWDAGATVAVILADIARMWAKVTVDTNYIYTPDTLVLSTEAFDVIHTPVDLGAGVYGSVADVVMKTYGPKGLKEIIPCAKLTTGTTGAPGGAPRQLLYKKDSRVLAHQTPVFFEQFVPQAKGLALYTACHSRIGGVHVEQHKAITYMDGVVT